MCLTYEYFAARPMSHGLLGKVCGNAVGHAPQQTEDIRVDAGIIQATDPSPMPKLAPPA